MEHIPANKIRGMMDFVGPLFEKANHVFVDFFTVDALIDDIEEGKKQCFVVDETVLVTQVEEYPNGKALRIVLAAGKNWEDWIILADDFFCEMARLNGCKAVITGGRRGWAKYAKDNGWKIFSEYRKELK